MSNALTPIIFQQVDYTGTDRGHILFVALTDKTLDDFDLEFMQDIIEAGIDTVNAWRVADELEAQGVTVLRVNDSVLRGGNTYTIASESYERPEEDSS